METLIYQDLSININDWLESIRLREVNENKKFIINFINKGIEGDVVFYGYSDIICFMNEITTLDCPNVSRLICHINEISFLNCPNVTTLICSDNHLTSLYCPLVTKLYCNFNILTSLYCPLAIKINCSFNEYLVKVTCSTNTEVICDDSCKIIRICESSPEVIHDNYNCNICGDDRTSKIVCKECKNFHCVECYISLFKFNKGLVKCPYCRLETKFDIDNNLEGYIKQLQERLI